MHMNLEAYGILTLRLGKNNINASGEKVAIRIFLRENYQEGDKEDE